MMILAPRLRRLRLPRYSLRTLFVVVMTGAHSFKELSMSTLLMLFATIFVTNVSAEEKPDMYPQLQEFMRKRELESDQITAERKAQLKKISAYVKAQIEAGRAIRLTFICTHNSRRSQMAQVWATAAARFYGVGGVEAYSGGTEATAFNSRAVAALERAGLKVERIEEGTNPHYAVRFGEGTQALDCFSKVYHDAHNPQENYCAVMTCSQADKSCPNVKGCSLRVALPFEDPKVADDTVKEASTYDERCQQICREMMFLFSEAADR